MLLAAGSGAGTGTGTRIFLTRHFYNRWQAGSSQAGGMPRQIAQGCLQSPNMPSLPLDV